MRVAAVMVDLGWPWWVGLIIAFSAATACALALVKTRHGVARGVVGLVVVQGVALGVLSPFVMSGSSAAGTGAGMDPAAPAMASGSRSSGTSIHVIEHAPPPDMRTIGNLTTFANPIFDGRNANQVGRDQGFCIHIVLAKSSECVWTTVLAGGVI